MNKLLHKLDINITKIRKSINPKYFTLFMYAIFVVTAFGLMYTLKSFKVNKILAQNSYNRAMFESLEYMKNVEVLLTKLNVTSTPKQSAKTLAEIWKQSNLTKTNLVELPTTQRTIESASKFLTQLSDYSYYLMKKNLNEEEITDKERKNLEKMYSLAVNFRVEMEEIVDKLESGRLKWNETEKLLAKNMKEKKSKSVSTIGIESIGKTFQDYEGLIYDGAFSDHIVNIEPKTLKGDNIEAIDAENIIKKIFKDYKIKYIGLNKGKIETYSFECIKDKEVLDVEVTKNSGKILWFIRNAKATKSKIKVEEAVEKGKAFLDSLGINNMKESYYEIFENMVTVNYAPVQEDVILYPDLIKLKISLEDGSICSGEFHGYIYNHHERKNIKPKQSIRKAKEVINKNVKITNERLAIIPTESKSEVLTYEFSGTINGKNFLIYINADTLEEEKILLIIDSDKGTLTM